MLLALIVSTLLSSSSVYATQLISCPERYADGTRLIDGDVLRFPNGERLKDGDVWRYPGGNRLVDGDVWRYKSGNRLVDTATVWRYENGNRLKDDNVIRYENGNRLREEDGTFRDESGNRTTETMRKFSYAANDGSRIFATILQKSETLSVTIAFDDNNRYTMTYNPASGYQPVSVECEVTSTTPSKEFTIDAPAATVHVFVNDGKDPKAVRAALEKALKGL